MSPPHDTERLLRESGPVVAILFFWNVLSAMFHSPIQSGLFWAGVVMALLYVVVRGIVLAKSVPATPSYNDVGWTLQENVRIAIPAGIWFLGAHVLYSIDVWEPIPGLETLALAFSGAGVGVVLLYALAVGLPRALNDASHIRGDATDATPADD